MMASSSAAFVRRPARFVCTPFSDDGPERVRRHTRVVSASLPRRAPTTSCSAPPTGIGRGVFGAARDGGGTPGAAVGEPSPRGKMNRRSVLAAPVGVLAALASVHLPARAADVDAADAVAPSPMKADREKKRILLLGATGRVGSATALALLREGHDVRAIVRDRFSLPPSFLPFISASSAADGGPGGRLMLIEASVASMSLQEMADAMRGCDAVVQCLGHRLTPSGVFGEPRRLCRDAAALVFDAWDTIQEVGDTRVGDDGDAAVMTAGPDDRWSMPVASARRPERFILLASAGADNPAGTDPIRSLGERAFIAALAGALPPFADTLAEVDLVFGKRVDASSLQWTVIRPDDFLDETAAPTETSWVLHERLQNGLFDAQVSSVVNIGACMAALAVGDESLWRRWAGKMPQVLDDPQPRREGRAA